MYCIKNFHVLADWVISQVLHVFLVLSLQFHHENTFSKTQAARFLESDFFTVTEKKSQAGIGRNSNRKVVSKNKRNLLTTWRQKTQDEGVTAPKYKQMNSGKYE